MQTALIPFGNVISRLAKKTRAKYIVEVLDLWPNSLVELGVAKASNPVIKYLYHLEYKQYQHADELVFSQEGGPDYLSDRNGIRNKEVNLTENMSTISITEWICMTLMPSRVNIFWKMKI